MFKKFIPSSIKKVSLIDSAEEYALYNYVAEQLEQGQMDKGIYAKAFSKAKGDKNKADALYLELMVEHLKLSADVLEIIGKEHLKHTYKNSVNTKSDKQIKKEQEKLKKEEEKKIEKAKDKADEFGKFILAILFFIPCIIYAFPLINVTENNPIRVAICWFLSMIPAHICVSIYRAIYGYPDDIFD